MAHVTSIDTFGNLTTDLPASLLPDASRVLFRLGENKIHGVADSYGHKQPGELVAVIDSEEFIELAIVNGNAALALGVQAGDAVEVIFGVK
jgi:S-adenosylmethionine hydrolase